MMKPKIGTLIPIRLASERLPGKALKEAAGKPMVCHLLDRVFSCRYINESNPYQPFISGLSSGDIIVITSAVTIGNLVQGIEQGIEIENATTRSITKLCLALTAVAGYLILMSKLAKRDRGPTSANPNSRS